MNQIQVPAKVCFDCVVVSASVVVVYLSYVVVY